ncbi:MAG: MFS transporter [Gammaproteobacteria bacterium]
MKSHERNLLVLACCQALYMTSNTLVISTSALVGIALAPVPSMATLPLGLQFLASMAIALPASLLMRRFGRRAGFRLGAAAGLAAGALCVLAIWYELFWLMCVSGLLYGLASGTGSFYRFAAADSVAPERKARAISLVLAGGLVAAFIGPSLAEFSRDWLWPAVFAGTYACLVVLQLIAFILLGLVDIAPLSASERRGPTRPLAVIASQPRFFVASFGAMSGYAAMNLLMTSTPLAMQVCGHAFSSTATVIQWHVVGMFAPSFFTGSLIRRFGVLRMMQWGAVLTLLCVGVNLAGTTVVHFWLALALLGLGWNFLYIGATALLTESYTPAEQAKAQGLNDFLVFATVAMTAFTSGYLHHAVGWTMLNLGVVPVIVAAAAGTVWLARGPRTQTA